MCSKLGALRIPIYFLKIIRAYSHEACQLRNDIKEAILVVQSRSPARLICCLGLRPRENIRICAIRGSWSAINTPLTYRVPLVHQDGRDRMGVIIEGEYRHQSIFRVGMINKKSKLNPSWLDASTSIWVISIHSLRRTLTAVLGCERIFVSWGVS